MTGHCSLLLKLHLTLPGGWGAYFTDKETWLHRGSMTFLMGLARIWQGGQSNQVLPSKSRAWVTW